MLSGIINGAKLAFRSIGGLGSRGANAAVKSFQHTGGGVFARALTSGKAGATSIARGYGQLTPAARQAVNITGGVVAGGAVLNGMRQA